MEQVTIRINKKDASFEVEVNGVQGSGCEDITAALTQNNEVLESQVTAEYHEEEELPDYVHTPEVE